MRIYNYHPVTKEYVSESIASKSPADNSYLIPAHATKIKPMKGLSENETQVFKGGVWVAEKDFRGKTYYSLLDGRQHKITEIGEDVPKTGSIKPVLKDGDIWRPISVSDDIRELIDQKKLDITVYKEEKQNEPITINNVTYKGGSDSLDNLEKTFRLSQNLELSEVEFLDVDNVSNTLNIHDALSVIVQLSEKLKAMRFIEADLHKKMESIQARTVDDANSQIDDIVGSEKWEWSKPAYNYSSSTISAVYPARQQTSTLPKGEIIFKGQKLSPDLDYELLRKKMIDMQNHFNSSYKARAVEFQWENIKDNRFSFTELQKLIHSLNLAGISI